MIHVNAIIPNDDHIATRHNKNMLTQYLLLIIIHIIIIIYQ